MLPTHLSRVAVVAFAVLAVACGDPTRAKATYASASASYVLYALTGAPPVTPNALNFFGGSTRASATFAFDIALDIDATGKVVVYPVRALGGALAGTLKRVGLQTVSGGFESVREVPAAGYDTVGARTIAPGTVLAVELRDQSYCYSAISLVTSQLLYAKFVVDSVHLTTRKIFTRVVVDPNCGYRMVVPDSVPTN